MTDSQAGRGARADVRVGGDLRSLIRVARRRGWIVLLCAVVGAGVALGATTSQQKKYTATAVLYFQTTNFDQALFGSASPVLGPSSDPARQAANDLGLATLSIVARQTARTVGMNVADLDSAINVSAESGSDLVSVSATTPNPAQAARVATTFATTFVSLRRAADQSKIVAAEKLVQKQLASLTPAQSAGPEGASLRNRGNQLRLLAALQTGNVEVVQQAAAPSTPSSPRPKRSGVLGGLLGLLVGFVVLILLERLDRSVRDAEELGRTLGLPVLAVIPQSRVFSRREVAGPQPGEGPSEIFYMLRAKLRYFNVDRQIKTILVTSAAPKDGKSTVSWHLALTAARGGAGRVILLEADLRRPTVVSERRLPAGPGLTDVLAGEASLADVIRDVPARASQESSPMLHVLPAGFAPPNPAELIESRKMSELLSTLSSNYDVVIIDTPPTAIVSDAVPLIAQVDGVIIVGRLHQTRKDAVSRLVQDLTALKAPLLGIVVNGARRSEGSYGYGYGYGQNKPVDGDVRKTAHPLEDGQVSAPAPQAAAEPATGRTAGPEVAVGAAVATDDDFMPTHETETKQTAWSGAGPAAREAPSAGGIRERMSAPFRRNRQYREKSR